MAFLRSYFVLTAQMHSGLKRFVSIFVVRAIRVFSCSGHSPGCQIISAWIGRHPAVECFCVRDWSRVACRRFSAAATERKARPDRWPLNVERPGSRRPKVDADAGR